MRLVYIRVNGSLAEDGHICGRWETIVAEMKLAA